MGILVPDLEIRTVGYVCDQAYVAISREPVGMYKHEGGGWRVCTSYSVWTSLTSRLVGRQPVTREALEFFWTPGAGADTMAALYDHAYVHVKAAYPGYQDDQDIGSPAADVAEVAAADVAEVAAAEVAEVAAAEVAEVAAAEVAEVAAADVAEVA